MNALIQTKEDLIEYLTTKQIASKFPPDKVYVTSNLRKIVMTDAQQGKFIHKGRVKKFIFKSIGGGVYEASIDGGM